tara:strand:- start:8048 stop:8812 length:765 start_codon:yes stop_codon:yes gene_type:complete
LSTGLNNIIYEKNIIRKENLVIGVVFILLSSPFVNTPEVWVSGFLLLFVFNFLMNTYQKDLAFAQFYNASFLLSLITYLHPNMIFLTSLFIINGINYSNINWRIIITILLGFITPYLFLATTLFLLNKPFNLPEFFNLSFIDIKLYIGLCYSQKTWIILILIITFLSFFELFNWLYKKSIKSRKTFMTIIWFLFLTLLITVFSGWYYIYFSLIPLTVIVSNYFIYTKHRKTANLLFLLLVISSFYYKYTINDCI